MGEGRLIPLVLVNVFPVSSDITIMRIDFNQLQHKHIEDPAESAAPLKSGSSKVASKTGDVFPFNADGISFGHSEDNFFSNDRNRKKSIAEQAAGADVKGVEAQMQQMLVVAQTMSPADAKKLADEGYDMGSLDPEDAVNSLDRIKIKLAEAGVNVAGYTDTVSADKVASVTGRTVDSGTLASEAALYDGASFPEEAYFSAETTDTEIAETLMSYDLPASNDNVASVREAINMTSELKDITDNTRMFLVSEGLEPTVANVFRAEFSSGRMNSSGNARYLSDDMGYVSRYSDDTKTGPEGQTADEGLSRQIGDIIEKAGYEDVPGIRNDAEKLIEAGMPLTPESLRIYEDSQMINIRPLKKEVMDSIAEGRPAKDAYLISDYRMIKAERIVKEAALSMTTEVNRKNLDKDLTIDTGYLEKDVESLKSRVRKAFDLLEATLSVRDEIRKAPAELIADRDILDVFDSMRTVSDIASGTLPDLNAVHEKAASLSARYAQMSGTYEAVGTEVRTDLGDSIKKAFDNTDFGQILEDLGADKTDMNERAVRIISYSHMELTADNLTRIREADESLNSVLDKLTPGRVLRLIRHNVNPLQTDLKTLETRLEGYEDEELRPVEDFARFLVSESRKGQVTEEEATSYIGIYRLINAINTGDHRAVGTLVASGAELSFSNLLSAVRTGRKSHVDQYAEGHFEGFDRPFSDGRERIDQMIRAAFDPSANEEESRAEEDARKFAEAAKAEAELFRALEEASIPRSADNIEAYRQLMSGGNAFARELFGNASDRAKDRMKETRSKVREALSSGDAEKIKESYDEMVKAELIGAFEGETLDIRGLQAKDKVLSIKRALSEADEYHIPVEFGGELININLRLRHGENRNSVDIYFETEDFGSVHASLRVTDGIRGAIESERTAGNEYMRERLDAINEAAAGISGMTSYLKVGNTEVSDFSVSQDETPGAMDGSNTDNAMLYRMAKAVLDSMLS